VGNLRHLRVIPHRQGGPPGHQCAVLVVAAGRHCLAPTPLMGSGTHIPLSPQKSAGRQGPAVRITGLLDEIPDRRLKCQRPVRERRIHRQIRKIIPVLFRRWRVTLRPLISRLTVTTTISAVRDEDTANIRARQLAARRCGRDGHPEDRCEQTRDQNHASHFTHRCLGGRAPPSLGPRPRWLMPLLALLPW
jgi:hypothetical protein